MNDVSGYFSWHYLVAPKRIIKIGLNFLIFFYHYFSVALIARTIFSPWKRLTIKRKRALTFENFFYVLSFNLTSRSIGAIVRLSTLLTWLLIEIVTLLFFVIVTPLWVIIVGLTFPFYLFFKEKPDPALELIKDKITEPQEIFRFLAETEMGEFLFSRLGIPFEEVKTLLTTKTSPKESPLRIEKPSSARIFHNLAKNWTPFKKFLFDKKLDEEDILAVCRWFERIEKAKRHEARFWELENLLSLRGIAKEWAYGFTVNLDKYSEDLTRPLSYTHHLVGREKETQRIQQVLSRAKENNVLLVGQPGVGRNTITLEFARSVKEGKVSHALIHKRVLSLDLTTILGISKSLAKAQSSVDEVLKEATNAGNIILVIDNFDKYASVGSGRVNLTEIIKKYASGDKLQIIGITTPNDFQKYIF
ncbi:hypothetical protein AMJ51_02440, partial [Microgenomates bacterium DG_75]